MSKEDSCYKITLIMKSSAYPLFYRQLLYMAYIPHFYKKILTPTSIIFQKFQPPISGEIM